MSLSCFCCGRNEKWSTEIVSKNGRAVVVSIVRALKPASAYFSVFSTPTTPLSTLGRNLTLVNASRFPRYPIRLVSRLSSIECHSFSAARETYRILQQHPYDNMRSLQGSYMLRQPTRNQVGTQYPPRERALLWWVPFHCQKENPTIQYQAHPAKVEPLEQHYYSKLEL